MSQQKLINKQRERRKNRVRRVVRGTPERPRLSVYRSLRHISAKLIDDEAGKTLAAASSNQKEVESTGKVDTAKAVGKLIAERALAAGVTKVAFDRGFYRYHGRVKALADAAREAGLSF